MTEQEWLECDDFRPMIGFLSGKVSKRKCQLFACACLRCIWQSLDGELLVIRRAVEITEGLAEGLALQEEVESILRLTAERPPYREQFGPDSKDMAAFLVSGDAIQVAVNAAYVSLLCGHQVNAGWGRPALCQLIREIIGNPFRPVAFDPAWRIPKVNALAQTIYHDRRFSDMPILADALEEAGCTGQEILVHCRKPGEHVRGCWVVDLVLGKE